MAYWLMKSEPDAWSWDQQVKAGSKGAEWTGVRNHTAKQNLMKMKKGDRAFFYHSNVGKEIVGVVEVFREHHPDPTAEKGEPWVVVDVKALEPTDGKNGLSYTFLLGDTGAVGRAQVWYDPKTFVMSKRIVKVDSRMGKQTVTETFEELTVNPAIPDTEFRVSEKK